MPVNSVICEQQFARSDNYTNCKAMNGPCFNFFFTYLFDLNNLKTTGKVRILANPLSKFRMENILYDRNYSVECLIETEKSGTDEVSMYFYNDADKLSETCSCSRKYKCITLKFKCFKNGDKCKPFCHPESKCNCINK